MQRGAREPGGEDELTFKIQQLVNVIVRKQILSQQHVLDIARPRTFHWSANSCWFHAFIQCMAAYNLDAYKFVSAPCSTGKKRSALEAMTDFANPTSYEKGGFFALSLLFYKSDYSNTNMHGRLANVVGPFGALPVDSNGLYEPFIHKLDTIENVQSCFWLDVEHNVLTRYLKKFSDLLTMLEEKQLISSSGLAPMKEAVEEAKMNARKEYVKDQIEIARDTLGCEPRALYVLVGQNHFVARVKWYTGQCYLCDDLGGRVEKIDDLFAGVDYFKIFGILFVQVNKAAD